AKLQSRAEASPPLAAFVFHTHIPIVRFVSFIIVSFDHVVETFERVVGKEKNIKAIYKDVTLDEYFEKRGGGTFPAAKEAPEGDGIIKRDMTMLKEIHPGLLSLEAWMKEVDYDGTGKPLLKNLDHLNGK
ncbi:13433_t:CDS:2, partial [Acaulospora colombiana]